MKHSTQQAAAGQAELLPAYRQGDEITFGFEGNVRATVAGHRVIDGVVWLTVYPVVTFEVPVNRVVACERAPSKGVL